MIDEEYAEKIHDRCRRHCSPFRKEAQQDILRARSALLLGDGTFKCEAAGAGRVIEYNSIGGEYGGRTRPDTNRRAEIEF